MHNFWRCIYIYMYVYGLEGVFYYSLLYTTCMLLCYIYGSAIGSDSQDCCMSFSTDTYPDVNYSAVTFYIQAQILMQLTDVAAILYNWMRMHVPDTSIDLRESVVQWKHWR